jgi:tetratricopeptide (TPR) repeat protein
VYEQDVAVGHAVRAVYMYTGMADVARETGNEELLKACRRLWNNIVSKQLYITGGIGSTHHGEAFSFDYDLPNDTVYAESCASIGLIFFAHRMLQMEAKSTYADVMENWRAFDYLYIIFFPAGESNDARVRALLGSAVDLNQNYHDALAAAQADTNKTTGEAAAFAWFNVGTELHNLQDYAGAAAAYDQARQIGLPYRMLWYQFGPYRSYYYMARYQDVVDLASFAIDSVNTVPGLEEAYYWRGLSEIALGQPDKADADFRTALERHPNWQLAIDALSQMGLSP